MNIWDIILLVSVTALGALIAYIRTPRYKAFVLSFPVPFTLGALSLGKGIDVTHALGLMVLLAFWFGVYALRNIMKLPIVLSIALAAVGYCAIGAVLAGLVPRTEPSFWIAEVVVLGVAAFFLTALPHRIEAAHASSLPVWIKLPVLASVILALITIKSSLSGFMTVFPMMGVITAYEGRHSLWTMCRQVPVLMMTMSCMMAVVHEVEPHFGMGVGLTAGWLVMGMLLAVITMRRWASERAAETAMTGGAVPAGAAQTDEPFA